MRLVAAVRRAALGLLVAGVAPAATAQSLLDRPPSVSGDWVGRSGVVYFHFVHRFTWSDPPARKVSNAPTLMFAAGLPHRTLVGVNYATNSALAARYPNEWEFFARWAPLDQQRGAPLDLGGQVGYNLAAESVDGEVSAARRFGPVRLLAVGRALGDPYVKGDVDFAVGGGGTVRLRRWLALAGDYVTLTRLDDARGEKAAWSVGLHLAIPQTPHSLSLHVANSNNLTLQSASRGGSQRRYGFEFTIPITLARYFGSGAPPPAAAAAAPTGPTATAVIRAFAFEPAGIEIGAGTTVIWKNEDQVAHTVTAVDHSWESPLIPPGGSWSRRFDTAGTFAFFCTPHPFMKGTVVVR